MTPEIRKQTMEVLKNEFPQSINDFTDQDIYDHAISLGFLDDEDHAREMGLL